MSKKKKAMKSRNKETIDRHREKSVYYTNKKVRHEIDKLLKENAAIESSLGKDSTPKEREKAKVKQERLFQAVRKLDEDFYNVITVED